MGKGETMKTPLQELIEKLESRASVEKNDDMAKAYNYSAMIAAWAIQQEKEAIIKAYIKGYMDASHDDEESLANIIKGVEYFNNTFWLQVEE